MTNRDIYMTAHALGMTSEADGMRSATEAYVSMEELFDRDIVSVIKFVDELTDCNDISTLKKFLVAVLWENRAQTISSKQS